MYMYVCMYMYVSHNKNMYCILNDSSFNCTFTSLMNIHLSFLGSLIVKKKLRFLSHNVNRGILVAQSVNCIRYSVYYSGLENNFIYSTGSQNFILTKNQRIKNLL